MTSKLVLGAAQLGLDYGINNKRGKPSREESLAILDRAFESGINTFDTAFAYGDAEEIFGEFMESRGVRDKVSIISKLKPHTTEVEEEIIYTEHVIREITGATTKIFRPPKAWMQHAVKDKIFSMGYKVVLWSLNSKDWVMFHYKSIVNFISARVKNGDILLFHDSGNIFSIEGGDRMQTVKSIGLLAKTLRSKGFEFVTVGELINEGTNLQRV